MPTNRVCGSWGWKLMCLVWAMCGGAGKAPLGRIHRPQGREFRPVAPEIVAIEQVRRLRPGKNARAAGQSGAGQAIDVVLREPVVSALPGVAAVAAGEDRAVIHPREDRATVGLDQQGVDVLIGQRPGSDVPAGPSASRSMHTTP